MSDEERRRELPGWERIDAAFLESRRSQLPSQRVLGYFSGKEPAWEEALLPTIQPREIVTELHGLVRRARTAGGTCVTVLMSATGEGKSTALRQTVAKIVDEDLDINVIWRRDLSARLPVSKLVDLPASGHWLFVADSAETVAKDVFQGLHILREAGRADVHFLLCGRRTDWVITQVPAQHRWENQCDLEIRRLRGVSPKDAAAIISAWAAYGVEGMGELAELTAEEAARRLVSESSSETHPDEGSLLGALLRLRYGDKLQSHVASLIDRLDSAEHFGVDLVTALAYIAIPHSDGLLTLPRVVLAKALGTDLVHLDQNVVYPLADEALVAGSGTAITTRHRAIAECVTAEMRERYHDTYTDDVYVELSRALIEARKEDRIAGDFETWNLLPRRFFKAGHKSRAIQMAKAMSACAPDNIYYCTTYAGLLREDDRPAEALSVLYALPEGTSITRPYCYECAASAGMAGDLAANVVLALLSLADWPDTAPPTNDNAKIILNGVTQARRRRPRAARTVECGGAAQLGLTLELDATAVRYLNRSHSWAAEQGVSDVSPEAAFQRVLNGLVAAWQGMKSDPPEFVKPPSDMSFHGLRRLLRLAEEP